MDVSNISLLFDFGTGNNEVTYPFEATNLPKALETKSVSYTLGTESPTKVSAVASIRLNGKDSQCNNPSEKINCVSGTVGPPAPPVILIAGPNYGSFFQNDNSNGGTVSWDVPFNAQYPDDIVATAINPDSTDGSEYLSANGFGFNLPAGSTIKGIKVEVKKGSEAFADLKDKNITLVINGIPSGQGKASPASWDNNGPSPTTYTTYGSETDLWGLTIMAADINPGFGVAIGVIEDKDPGDAYIDHIRITVYYTN